MSIFSLRRTTLIELAVFMTIILSSWAEDMIPYFPLEPESSVVPPGTPVTLRCRVHPTSAQLLWRFNNELLEMNNSYGFKRIGSDLHLPPTWADSGDTAVFQCLARTPLGTVASRPAKISKAVLRKFENKSDLHFNVTEGSNLILPCEPPYSRPPARITYKLNRTTIIDKDTDHYKILPSGRLQVLGVRQQDAGAYQCFAENPLRNQTRTAKHISHVSVINIKVPIREPSVDMPETKIHAKVGDDVVLECSAGGNPQPDITWERYGGKFLPDRYTKQFGNLYLNNVTDEDGGTYLCKAFNGLNTLNENGVKALVLEISEPPVVVPVRQVVNVSLGGYIALECIITGTPDPHITWLHNGNILKHFTREERMVIRYAEAGSQGVFQCFAENEAGVAYASMLVNVDVTKRESGSQPLSDQNVTTNPEDDDAGNRAQTPAGRGSGGRRREGKDKDKGQRNRKKSRGKKKSGKSHNLPTETRRLKKKKAKMVPPTRPQVTQLSDTSVMLNWTVKKNDGLKITFFKVQYKMVAPKKDDWKTAETVIENDVFMFEVMKLEPRSVYKFRIAAVYSNDDNAHSSNSDRFVMKTYPEPVLKPPKKEPQIVEVTALNFENTHALNVKWQNNIVTSTPIEGFYIFYKPYHSADDFQNATLLEPSVRAHLLKNLQPGTEYLIKMQSFNAAGKSPFSTEVVEKTKGEAPVKVFPPPTDEIVVQTLSPEHQEPEPEENGTATTERESNNMKLYMYLGIAIGVMMLVLLVFICMCWLKQRQQRRMMDAINDVVRNKFEESPQQRAVYTDSLRAKMKNGGVVLNGMNGTIANGHIPRNYHKMNINVNPLSELETLNSTDGSNHFTPTTFHPNGSLPGHQRASDNNCNNINQSKSLETSLQHVNHQSSSSVGGDGGDVSGGGESLASPPSPVCNNVPMGHSGSEAHERRSISTRSGGDPPGSCDPCDSSLSYEDTGGVHSARHRKRRRRPKEQTTKDQATNTDLSSNDGTMDLAEYNKAISSSRESGQLAENPHSAASTNSYDSRVILPSANAV